MSESAFSNLVFGRPVNTGIIGKMSDLRICDLNLIYLIKEQILPVNGYVSRITETLSPSSQDTDSDTGLPVTIYQASFNDFVYYNPDPSNPALSGLMTVPTINTSGSLSYIDYSEGLFYYSGFISTDITVTYDYYSVRVQDGFPDFEEDTLVNLRVPAVSVDFTEKNRNAFQVGGGYSDTRNFIINITAANDPQRDDLTELIENSLKFSYDKTIDYNLGFPINFNGTINTNFDRGLSSRWKQIQFENIDQYVIRDVTLTDKLRHQSNISLDITISY